MTRPLAAAVLISALAGTAPAAAAASKPSRPPVKGCAWERLQDANVGLAAWVQRCDFGFRKIDFAFQGRSLEVRFSDGGAEPDPVVDVLDLTVGETPQAGIRRLFVERTDPAVARRCVLAPYRGRGVRPRADVRRFTFVPDAAYEKELAAKRNPDEVGDPPCGDWGDAPDGIQYFEAHPANPVRKILFVRYGQDEPLFDERTLELLGW